MIEKMNVAKGRVTNAGKGAKTPIPGKVAQAGSPDLKTTRVGKAPGLARVNDPKSTHGKMGLQMGSRVTSRETRKR